ncbi:MAG: hypothetical protein EU539_12880 [Promethearchaeota archaeon]|nr:MAG: hypothetical protein EU539_12880 [Candidatus Lokiarchaeota archaeon]
MDTEYDFITPEFLHLIFFKQKSIVIFPHVDLKHLRGLEAFTIGYNLIDLEATALYNIREMVKSDAESYSHTPNYHLIYNLDKEKAKQLLDLENAHAILNITQNASDLVEIANENFIFYNKKSSKFLNYDFSNKDLKMERMILSLAKTYDMIRDELQNIKQTANKIYTTLMNSPEKFNIDKLTDTYKLAEKDKIIEFTENYYDIILPGDNDDQCNAEEGSDKLSHDLPKGAENLALDFSSEFNIIHSQNKRIFQVFIIQLDEYRTKNVNQSNLELNELFTPSSLYNYLRRHHWSEGIPRNFLIQWKNALSMNGGLSEEDLMDFQLILQDLGIQYNIFEQDIVNKETNKNKNRLQYKKYELDFEKTKIINGIEESIPSLSDFPKFREWVIQKLNIIEERLRNSK